MEPARHLDLLRIEGDRLAAMPAEALDAPVASLPDWTVERVLRHTGKVHRWVTATLAAGPDADLNSAGSLASLPNGPGCLPAYREALEAVIAELTRHDPTEPSPTFAGAGTAAFWFRRQANEVAVHRMDAADALHAAGGPAPEPLAVDAAADAIDEWATLFLGTLWAPADGQVPAGVAGRSIHVHGTDDPAPPDGAEWLIAFTDDGVQVEARHAKGDTALRGPAQDLLMTLWRRRPLDTIEVIGDRGLAERVLDLARF